MTENKRNRILPPSSLNVQRFAEARSTEIEALHSIIKERLNNDFRSHRNKRRRTTGHDNRVGKNKRYPKRQSMMEDADSLGNINSNCKESIESQNKLFSRRIRRRIELKKNYERGFACSGDGTKRLRTHVWHTKRFSMIKLWGYHLPLGLHGRGRGSRALLKRTKNGVLLHDASYFSAVQLEGSQEAILSILSMVLTPSPESFADDLSASLINGDFHRNAMLHHVGAPISRAIAPVIYMWRPFSHDVTANHEQHAAYNTVSLRQLWVWIHASAFNEGYMSINSACEKRKKEAEISIKCCSLEGQLAKLELMGSRVLQLLQKILIPVTSVSNVAEKSGQLGKCSLLEHGKQICVEMFLDKKSEYGILPCTVIPLFVCDPRSSKENNSKLDTCLISSKSDNLREKDGGEEEDCVGLTEMPKKNVEFPSSLSMLEEKDYESLAVNLWDIGKGMIHPPLETIILDKEKHDQKLVRFGIRNAGLEKHISSSETKLGRFCPILLLNDATEMGHSERWSIILPLSWVNAFWLPLISKGAHAVGLREKQWIAGEIGLPSFPSDFPDCDAYSQFMATKAAVSVEKSSLRPPVHRPLSVPLSPPWESIHFAFDGKAIENAYSQAHTQNLGSLNEGFVPRTSSSLAHFLTENNEDDMLLFPYGDSRRNDIIKTMREHGKNDSFLLENRRLSNKGKKMCFVRVLLHAFREGVFEDGAIVCAANVPDINLWLARSENHEGGVQISQSMVSSYFEQQSCGKWEVQLPEDPEARKSHRWPIGFVTSGFVQGSKKGGAVGLCEARLLGYTREAQWNEMAVEKRRKEIYVLVRNMRSTSYRLGLATLILEQQNQDLVSM